MPVSQTDSGWGLVDRAGAPLVTSPVYDGAMGELTYQHDTGEQQIHDWSLPQQLLGGSFGLVIVLISCHNFTHCKEIR